MEESYTLKERLAKEGKFILLTPISAERLKEDGFSMEEYGDSGVMVMEDPNGYNIAADFIVNGNEKYITAIFGKSEIFIKCLYEKYDVLVISDSNPIYSEYLNTERKLRNACMKTRRSIMS